MAVEVVAAAPETNRRRVMRSWRMSFPPGLVSGLAITFRRRPFHCLARWFAPQDADSFLEAASQRNSPARQVKHKVCVSARISACTIAAGAGCDGSSEFRRGRQAKWLDRGAPSAIVSASRQNGWGSNGRTLECALARSCNRCMPRLQRDDRRSRANRSHRRAAHHGTCVRSDGDGRGRPCSARMRTSGALADQTMPSFRSAATSPGAMPSQLPSTSSTFWPSTGDGLTLGGTPSKRTGQAGILTLPVVG